MCNTRQLYKNRIDSSHFNMGRNSDNYLKSPSRYFTVTVFFFQKAEGSNLCVICNNLTNFLSTFKLLEICNLFIFYRYFIKSELDNSWLPGYMHWNKKQAFHGLFLQYTTLTSKFFLNYTILVLFCNQHYSVVCPL